LSHNSSSLALLRLLSSSLPTWIFRAGSWIFKLPQPLFKSRGERIYFFKHNFTLYFESWTSLPEESALFLVFVSKTITQ
ncbi:MAG: hypothetical protein Q7J16_10120, partial [Candidatus Cloacimonadales bacterium]|nr:hypothetical protein [Candidatus Cloacimonadales bacterium]